MDYAGKCMMQDDQCFSITSIVKADPIRYFLRTKLGINSILRAIIFGLVLRLLYFILVPGLSGNLDSALNDIPSILISVTIIPAVVVFYCAVQPYMLSDLMDGLKNSDRVRPNNSTMDELLNEFCRLVSSRWIIIASLLFTAIAAYITAADVLSASQSDLIHWVYDPEQPHLFFLIFMPINTLLLYMGMVFLTTHLVSIYGIRKIFQVSEVDVFTLHPDKCGGLSFLGVYSIRVSYFLGVIGLNFGLLIVAYLNYLEGSLSDQPLFLIGIVIYVILVPAVFILTLYPAHDGMRAAKRESQAKIAEKAEYLYEGIQDRMDRDEEVDTDIERLEAFHSLYSLTEKLPVWPFDFKTVRRLITVTLSPLLTAILIEALTHFLLKIFPE